MRRHTTVDPSLPEPARNILTILQSLLGVHRKTALELVHAGAVFVNDRTVSQAHCKLSLGDRIEVEYAPQPAKVVSKRQGSKPQFEIAYDDEHLMLVVKPADLLTVPTPKRERNTLIGRVQQWLDDQQPGTRAFCVQRLDRGVSGIIVLAKSLKVAELLRNQFQARKPDRQYIAIVAGKIVNSVGTMKSFLATDKQLNRFSVEDELAGELAITHYEVKEFWEDSTLVEVRLETGRRNQIRVHFAEAGHPVIGDPRYRTQQAAHRWWSHKRLALHAESLGFEHPISHASIKFIAPWPQEFRDFRKAARRSLPDRSP